MSGEPILTYEYSNDEIKPERQAYVILDLHIHIGAHRFARRANYASLAAFARVQDPLGSYIDVAIVEPRIYRDPIVHEIQIIASGPSKILPRPRYFLRRIPMPFLPLVLLVRLQALHL